MLPFLQKRKSHFGALSNFSVLSLLQMAQQAFIELVKGQLVADCLLSGAGRC